MGFLILFLCKNHFLGGHGVSKITPLKPQLTPPKTQYQFDC